MTGVILKIASGSGRARRPFFEKFPNLVFQPSDREPDALQSVAAGVKATRASNSRSALSPAGQRTSSTSHRGRPTPGTGNGVDGRAEIRHRVAAVGCPRSVASVWRRQHAARRRDFSSLWWRVGAAAAVRSSEGARPPQRPRPARHDETFLKAIEDCLLVAAFEIDDRSDFRSAWARAGAKRSGRSGHRRTLPRVRAAIPATKRAAAAPSIAPLPPPATS